MTHTQSEDNMTSGWKTVKLGEIAQINPTETLKKGTTAKKVAMEKLRPYCRDIPEYELSGYNGGAKFRNGDTIMARITPCLENGKIAKVGILDEGEVGFGSTEFIVFRANEGYDEDFVYYLVCSSDVKAPAIKSMVGSSGRQRVQTDVVQNLQLRVPPLGVQRRIAAVLKPLDDKIEMNARINARLERVAQLILTKHISSDFSIRLKDMMSFENGFAFQSRTYCKTGKYRVITIKNVQDGFIDSSRAEFIDEPPVKMKAGCYLRKGDVLLSLTGSVGRVGIVYEDDLLLNQRVAKIVPKDKTLLPFLYYYFRMDKTKIALEILAKGSVQANLSPIETLNLTMPFKEYDMQTLASLFTAFFRTEIALNAQSRTLARLRDVLLPRLMSGAVDVRRVDLNTIQKGGSR